MATRNLTPEYVRARAAATSRAGEAPPGSRDGAYDMRPLDPSSSGYGTHEDDSEARAAALTNVSPAYVDRVDEINRSVISIKDGIRELKELHERRLTAVKDEDAEDLEHRIDLRTHQVTQSFSSAGRALKSIAADRSLKGDEQRTAEESIRLNIQRSLAGKLHKLSGEFRSSQKKYLTRVQSLKKSSSLDALTGGRAAAGGAASAGDVDEGFSQGMMQELDDAEAAAQDRDQEIASIARSITELAEVFKELNVLVVDQGTILDRIDYNLDLTVERVKAGVKDIEVAEEYQKSGRPMWCMGVLMVLIVIMIIVIAVKKS